VYDEEAVYQDADILMMEYAREGRALANARKRGNCCHSSVVGYVPGGVFYPEQVGLNPGELRCTEGTNGCDRVFFSDEDWDQARQEALYL
jgi:hypothetical protein